MNHARYVGSWEHPKDPKIWVTRYKAFTSATSKAARAYIFGGTFSRGKTYRSKKDPRLIGNTYGFHTFGSEPDGEAFSSNSVVLKVKVRGLIASGWQAGLRCKTYKYMKVLKDGE